MARKKAYQRFEELTKRAMAPAGAEAERGQGSMDGGGSPPEAELSIWLTPEVRRALLERAAADNTTASKIIEEALRRHFSR